MLFFAKPEEYFHNLWFRAKMVLLAAAILNVFIFHKLVQNNQAAWDAAPSPPSKAKISAVVSLASWVLIIAFGRFIGYDKYQWGKAQWEWVNIAQDCQASSLGAMSIAEGKAMDAEVEAAAAAAAQAPSLSNASLPEIR